MKNPWMDFQKQINRQIQDSNPPITAKITAVGSNGTYTVQTLDGYTLFNVKNQSRTKWKESQWVAVENIGGDWIIIGLSPQRGGD